MLAAAVLASLWAQAEPAPAGMPSQEPRATAAPAPGAPAPGTPAPRPATAAPAAAAPGTPAPAAPEPVLDNAFGVYGCFAYRIGSEARSIGPAGGVSVGGDYERRYFATPEGFELGAGLDFFYDRFSADLTGSTMLDPGLAERLVSQTSFAVLQTIALRIGRVRPFAKAGVGVTIAYFSSPEIPLRPGSFDAVQPLARAVAGVSVVARRGVAVALQGAYTHPFTRPVYTASDGTTYSFLGDLFDLGLGVVMSF